MRELAHEQNNILLKFLLDLAVDVAQEVDV
jgi:hypothetical protein